ncbi:HIT family protein [Pyrococcus furiosus DSM 3638]|uniref:Hit family protein (Hit) n=3 Tax=Pyrococcus furiosus TaxID=2261 RepID=Q8U1U8_PYRFU|nr:MULTISPECIES: HIT family protein [Pyrococcus]AAL81231.1 hit family protein (hit) [Pyrococcus furiosus DSM 3638]AFN03899.1 hit family protein [Pyrococcus furiosus COM1]MDK2868771.1 hypothetical protein [Pyrococcus sp.]QEK78762.1 HIT family protein [Pyrococcus furiosus DSM 3638]
MPCPFCNPPAENIVYEDDKIRILLDSFPANPGHLLVVPKRHITNIEGLNEEEKVMLMKGVEMAIKALKEALNPDGFNVGINLGKAAGQTVSHLHVHVIPRYKGDCKHPEGGIRKAVLNAKDENLGRQDKRLESKYVEILRGLLNEK